MSKNDTVKLLLDEIVRPWQAGVLKKGLQYMTICKRTGDKGTRCRHKKIIPKLPKHKEPTLSHHIPHTLSIRQYQNPNHLPHQHVCSYVLTSEHAITRNA